VFHSSGTTQQNPSRHFHCDESLAIYEASLLRWFTFHFSPFVNFEQENLGACSPAQAKSIAFPQPLRTSLLILTPPPASAPHSSLVHMFEVIRRSLGAEEPAFVGSVTKDGRWTVDAGRAAALLEQPGLPVLVLGTAFSFVHLLDRMADQSISCRLPAGSSVLETGGYKGLARAVPKAELHAIITTRLGIPATHIISEYGMSELSSQAYDSALERPSPPVDTRTRNSQLVKARGPRHRLFQFPAWARAVVVSPETGAEVQDGESGLLRIVDLANVYSVMAIQTEDLATRRGEAFELVGRAALAEPRGCSLASAGTQTPIQH
jgi:hypothetical protein